MKRILLIVVTVLFLLPACRKEIVPKAFFPRSAHEAYRNSLEEANLIETALGRDWVRAGKDSKSILSFFGDPRDGGSREHHGVDIFAPRHTPVLAPSNASVTRIGKGDIGGRYVWLYDSKRSLYLYFAHLETQEVQEGEKVLTGQLIGTVGNTGNARYTPPHLHFGIYRNGPIDPYYFISETDTLAENSSNILP